VINTWHLCFGWKESPAGRIDPPPIRSELGVARAVAARQATNERGRTSPWRHCQFSYKWRFVGRWRAMAPDKRRLASG